jgi:hypothetical protein
MKALSGSFQDFLKCPHSRINSTNWVGPINDPRAMLLDRDARFRQAVSDFAHLLDAYRGGPREAKRPSDQKPKAQPKGNRSFGEFRSVITDEAEHRAVIEKLRARPPFTRTTNDGWIDRLKQIKRRANCDSRLLAQASMEESSWLDLLRTLPGEKIDDQEALELRHRILNHVNCKVI